mmetsp:Transcript_18278/g.52167  ORF Transcript_18278/g.52167 Transcript_18278/m.52167 type:complete len:330 (+) Transcript_18278:1559-2548(+)
MRLRVPSAGRPGADGGIVGIIEAARQWQWQWRQPATDLLSTVPVQFQQQQQQRRYRQHEPFASASGRSQQQQPSTTTTQRPFAQSWWIPATLQPGGLCECQRSRTAAAASTATAAAAKGQRGAAFHHSRVKKSLQRIVDADGGGIAQHVEEDHRAAQSGHQPQQRRRFRRCHHLAFQDCQYRQRRQSRKFFQRRAGWNGIRAQRRAFGRWQRAWLRDAPRGAVAAGHPQRRHGVQARLPRPAPHGRSRAAHRRDVRTQAGHAAAQTDDAHHHRWRRRRRRRDHFRQHVPRRRDEHCCQRRCHHTARCGTWRQRGARNPRDQSHGTGAGL